MTSIERIIERAVCDFADAVIDAVRGASLDELNTLQTKLRSNELRLLEGTSSAPPPTRSLVETTFQIIDASEPFRCSLPGCDNPRFPRGRGYCSEHWRQRRDGSIDDSGQHRRLSSE